MEQKQKDSLTNEKLKSKFTSQFELVNYAIKLAENMIHTGRGPRVRVDSDNVAQNVLSEIQAGKDQFVECLPGEEIEVHEPYTHYETVEISEEDFLKASDDFDDEFLDEVEEEEETPKKPRKKAKKAAAAE